MDDLLAFGLRRDPDGIALRDSDLALSWIELEERSRRLAHGFQQHGLRPGDRLASLVPNGVALVVLYLAGLRAGLVLTPLNYRYTPAEIDYALEVSGASTLVYHEERAGDVQLSRLAAALPLGTVCLRQHSGLEAILPDAWPAAEPFPTAEEAAPCFIYFTSGSTARPKGVTHSRSGYGALLASLSQALQLQPEDGVLAGSSLAHIASSSLALACLSIGTPVTVASQLDAASLLGLLRRDQPSVLLMLPSPLISLLGDDQLCPEDLASLRLCISGGDKVPRQLQREVHARSGRWIDECYGMTEVPWATLSPPRGEIRPGSVGQLCPGFAASIRSSDGVERPVGEEGHLWVRGASQFSGYWGNPQATADTVQKGWVQTGDLMRADADGYLWFCGRSKQIIVHDGSNICPQDVEEALCEHPAVQLAGVIGIPDPVHGEDVMAYVSLDSQHQPPSEAELIAFARERVGYKAPAAIRVLAAMPLNATGKTDRRALSQLQTEQLQKEAL
jgi:long-chain acyl-CoA synthetase